MNCNMGLFLSYVFGMRVVSLSLKIMSEKIMIICLYISLTMTFLSCNNVNERVKFKAQPHDSYVIEYGDGELYLSTENSKSKERYFLKENKYFSDEDSSVFLALKDTFFYTYNAFFKQIMMHRIRRIKNNVFVSELYDISCLNEMYMVIQKCTTW